MTLMVEIVIGTLLILLFVYFIKLPFNYWKNRNVPHPPISLLFGNVSDVILFKKSVGQVYHEIYTKYPDLSYVGFYKMHKPSILIRDPELIKEVTAGSFNSFRDNEIQTDEKYDPYFAKNPFAAKGQKWKEYRSQSAPSFTPKRINKMYPLMEGVAKNLVRFINDNAVDNPEGVDAKKLCIQYTTDVVANCALGIEANSFINPNSEYVRMNKKIMSPSFLNNIMVILMFITPSLAKLLKIKVIPDDVGEYYVNIVRSTLEFRKQNKIERGDFLDRLNKLREKSDPDSFTVHDITAHTLTFFTDGTETSALAFAFLLYELGLHPHIQTNIKGEIDEARHKHGGQLNYDVVQDMEYLNKVMNENMRKNGPVPFLVRMCTEQITLESPLRNGERVTIESGTPVIISSYSIHHDPKYYPNPSLFDPSRFSDENVQSRTKYTFLPFGEGPRICLGQRFGIAQIKVAIIHIIEHFEIRVNETTRVPYEIDPHYFMISPKGDIKLDFYKRH